MDDKNIVKEFFESEEHKEIVRKAAEESCVDMTLMIARYEASKARDEEWREKIEEFKTTPVCGNWDKKPCKEGEIAVYCLTCEEFLLESICVCAVKNKLLDDLINSMK